MLLSTKQRRRLTQKVTLLPDFPNDPAFLTLRMLTHDEPAILLGRVAMLALTALDQRRVVYLLTEVDQIAAWRPRPGATSSFGTYLIRVGWGREMGRLGVKLTMPEPLQIFNASSHAAIVRAERDGMKRGARGKFVGDRAPKRRKSRTPRYDADVAPAAEHETAEARNEGEETNRSPPDDD